MKLIPLAVAAACICAAPATNAISIFENRDAWHNAFIGARYEVNLASNPNNLAVGGTLASEAPIYLPPTFEWGLSFNASLNVVAGDGWNNYIDQAGDPLVLQTRRASLTGTFNNDASVRKFGFEVLPAVSGLLTLSLSDGTVFSKYVEAGGAPQFFGWVDTNPGDAGITSFRIRSENRGLTVGNFVVPDAANTLALLGTGLAMLAAFGRCVLKKSR